MTFRLTFKTPGVVDQLSEATPAMRAVIERFVQFGEYLTVELDTDAETATVVRSYMFRVYFVGGPLDGQKGALEYVEGTGAQPTEPYYFHNENRVHQYEDSGSLTDDGRRIYRFVSTTPTLRKTEESRS